MSVDVSFQKGSRVARAAIVNEFFSWRTEQTALPAPLLSAHAYDWLTSVDSRCAQGRGSKLSPIGSLNFDPAYAFRHERIVALSGPGFLRGGAGCAAHWNLCPYYTHRA